METYRISTKNTLIAARIAAATYQEAANKYALRELGKSASALRTTGDSGKTGWFQGYTWDHQMRCLNSVGIPFHVF